MSAKMVLARGLMRLADVLTPKDKEQWCAAIRAELSVLDETDSALGWAFGAFGMAVRCGQPARSVDGHRGSPIRRW